jgi:RNA polymerase sigma-70 factor (ECF subfamily)
MPTEPSDDLLGQLGRGEVEAAEALFQAYSPYLRAIVRRHLSDRLRSKFDSADVVQSVWVQVVRQLGRDGWRVESEDHLRALLATITRRRVASRARKHPDIWDEVRPGAAGFDAVPQARYSRPSEVAQADDLWERMLRLCPPEHRVILRLRREGLSLDEIAGRTGLHEGSVRRILRRLARELALHQEPLDGEAAG